MDELNSRLESFRKKYTLLSSMIVVFLLGTIAGFLWISPIVGGACIVLMLVFIFLSARMNKSYTAFFTENVIEPCYASCSFVDGLRYSREEGISSETVAGTGMIRTGTRMSSDNLVTGSYSGLSFSQSCLSIFDETGTGSDRTESEWFKGLWVVVELGKSLGGRVQAVSKKFRLDVQPKGMKKLDSSVLPNVAQGEKTFAESFEVYAENEQSARALLSSGVAGAMLKLLAENEEPIMLAACGDKLHIALGNRKNPALSPSLRKGTDISGEKQKITRQLRTVTDFIGALAGSI